MSTCGICNAPLRKLEKMTSAWTLTGPGRVAWHVTVDHHFDCKPTSYHVMAGKIVPGTITNPRPTSPERK